MRTKFLHIALIFSLIISVLGVSSCNALCSSFKDKREHSCCSTEQKHDCCSISDHGNTNSALSIVDASVDVPNSLLFAIATIYHFNFSAGVLDKEHSNYTYSPPLFTQDLLVLNQVFRI